VALFGKKQRETLSEEDLSFLVSLGEELFEFARLFYADYSLPLFAETNNFHWNKLSLEHSDVVAELKADFDDFLLGEPLSALDSIGKQLLLKSKVAHTQTDQILEQFGKELCLYSVDAEALDLECLPQSVMHTLETAIKTYVLENQESLKNESIQKEFLDILSNAIVDHTFGKAYQGCEMVFDCLQGAERVAFLTVLYVNCFVRQRNFGASISSLNVNFDDFLKKIDLNKDDRLKIGNVLVEMKTANYGDLFVQALQANHKDEYARLLALKKAVQTHEGFLDRDLSSPEPKRSRK